MVRIEWVEDEFRLFLGGIKLKNGYCNLEGLALLLEYFSFL